MGQLIDDLLAFSRLGRQQMTDTRIDMGALAQAVFDELAALTPGRQTRADPGSAPSRPPRETARWCGKCW